MILLKCNVLLGNVGSRHTPPTKQCSRPGTPLNGNSASWWQCVLTHHKNCVCVTRTQDQFHRCQSDPHPWEGQEPGPIHGGSTQFPDQGGSEPSPRQGQQNIVVMRWSLLFTSPVSPVTVAADKYMCMMMPFIRHLQQYSRERLGQKFKSRVKVLKERKSLNFYD